MPEENTEERLGRIEATLESVLERNRRVESEKAWETSKTRMIAIIALTYLLMCLTFCIIGIENYLVNAIIPTLGYFLSTQSLPVVKKKWLAYYK